MQHKRGSCGSVTALVCLMMLTPNRGPAQSLSTRTFELEEGGTVRVELGSGNIQITPWDQKAVRVNAVDSDDDLSISRNGNTIIVRSPSDGMVQVWVPRRISLDLQSGSGDIAIDGTVSGNLKGRTSGGEFTVHAFGGNVNLSTGGGGITCGDIKGKATIESAGGDLQLGSVGGDADLRTDGGDVDVKDVGSSVLARTSGGNVTIGRVNGDARLYTSGGDIEVGPVGGSTTLESSGGNIIVHGSGGRISASTSGGDLTLERIGGAFAGTTSAGNITADVDGRNGRCEGKLSSGGGNILLNISPSVNATITATVHGAFWGREDEDEPSISSDFPAATFRKHERSGDITATYRLNDGTGSITLDASMGSIIIRKGSR